jgi:branched-chain amino acid transport system ATP-binding protein
VRAIPSPAPENETTPLISIRSAIKAFGGVRAVDECSIDIAAGSITGLIGPNGAGKTTLFNIVTGFMQPDDGQVLLNGVDVTGFSPHRLFTLGLLRTFQIAQNFERMTVLDNLMVVPDGQSGENLLAAWLRWRRVRSEEREIRIKAEEALKFLDLFHLRDEFAGNLSGGQKKLLELGRTMMAEPRVVLLDEPGAGVNPTLMQKLSNNIRHLNKECGYTFCVIEHDMDLIAELCDPIIVMAEGRVLAQGTMANIRRDERVLEVYLGGSARGDGGEETRR